MLRLLMYLFLLIALLGGCSREPSRPEFIQDMGHLLSVPQIKRLCEFQQLLLLEHKVHLFVVTLENPARDLDQTALNIFEQRSLGITTGSARGLLLVIDPQAQQARIEVGYDLEHIFTDGFVAGLEYDQMLPFFQQGRIGQGIEALTELLVARLMDQEGGCETEGATAGHPSGGAGARIDISGAPAEKQQKARAAENYPAQSSPLATLERYRDSLAAREKSPELGIYTPETRAFFCNWLVTDAQQQNALKVLEQALPAAEVIIQGELAVIRFPVADRQASPYYLKHSADGWQLDFATMSRTIRFNHRNQWHFSGQSHPYMFAFADWQIDGNGFPHAAE